MNIKNPEENREMSEEEKALSGQTYNSADITLCEKRKSAAGLCLEYNNTLDDEKRGEILQKLLSPNSKPVTLQGPIQFAYGCNTEFGDKCYANFNFVVLDHAKVKIGTHVMFGPNCTILTPVHPMDWKNRITYYYDDSSPVRTEKAEKVTIGDNCWIAACVTICPGVTIGEGSVIGAGSVVLDDIPAGVFAAGVPCKVIKKI